MRDWLYVEDHCRAIDMIIHKGTIGEVYNVGGHNERTNLEVVKTVLHSLGKTDDLIEFVADRPGHDMRYAIDWFVSHQDWWKNILSGEYLNNYRRIIGYPD